MRRKLPLAAALFAAGMLASGCATQQSLQKAASSAQAAEKQGDYRAAAADLNPIVEADSQDPQAWIVQGYAYLAAGEYGQAIADATRAVDLEPDAAIYRLARSFAYARAGRLDRALEDSNDAVELAPNTALCYSSRGFAHMAMGDTGKALADFSRAIKLDPDEAMFYVQRGFAFGLEGNYAHAQSDWQTAIRVRSAYGPAYSALAWLQATGPSSRLRDPAQAVTNAKRGAELGDPTLVAALAALGIVQSAVKPNARESEPEIAWPLDALAAAYAAAGDFNQAVAVQKKAISANHSGPNPLLKKERELLGLYQQKKPYRGDFKSLVPALPWIVLPA